MISNSININQNQKNGRKASRKLQKTQESKKINLSLLFIKLLIVANIIMFARGAYCISGVEISPDKTHKIVWECKKGPYDSSVYSRNCRVSAIDTSGKTEWIHKEPDLPEPTVKWHDNNLAEIKIPCGSPCNYSIFYDVNKGVSVPYEFVIAVNSDKQLIARAGKSHILVNQIFRKNKQLIKKISRDYAETAALVLIIEEAHFTKKGNLFIRYLSGKNYVPKEETIPISIRHQKPLKKRAIMMGGKYGL